MKFRFYILVCFWAIAYTSYWWLTYSLTDKGVVTLLRNYIWAVRLYLWLLETNSLLSIHLSCDVYPTVSQDRHPQVPCLDSDPIPEMYLYSFHYASVYLWLQRFHFFGTTFSWINFIKNRASSSFGLITHFGIAFRVAKECLETHFQAKK